MSEALRGHMYGADFEHPDGVLVSVLLDNDDETLSGGRVVIVDEGRYERLVRAKKPLPPSPPDVMVRPEAKYAKLFREQIARMGGARSFG
jgi:hypothetical protein